ncbi:MAG TPA: DUF485 domain-containing protein [Anaeromyxobacteraceae bacterium]|nr:DUF485 domain-containing protein [Anaeromyxobacteraceae bacterium]
MAHAAPAGGGGTSKGTQTTHEMLESPAFKHLVGRRWSMSVIGLILLFVTYYGYVVLIGASPKTLAQKVGAFTTLGIPLGVAVILIAFALTWIYVIWANRSYDPEVQRLKSELKH